MHYKLLQLSCLWLCVCGKFSYSLIYHYLKMSMNRKSRYLCPHSHADKPDESSRFTNPGYLCPQCLSKHCELPVECRGCGLTLVSAPHLARSYHYLFPIKHFKEEQYEGHPASCYACQKTFAGLDKKVKFFFMLRV